MAASAATAEAFWVTGPGVGTVRPVTLPPAPPDGQVRVRTLFSGISRGTEALVFQGRVPADVAGQMRCPFQEGDFPAPVKYGYMAVGTAIDGPADRVGQTVFALHPHQTLFDVPAGAARPVPAGVPARRAVLAANMETALNVLWDSGAMAGDRIAVVGLGVVGLLVTYLAARLPATQVTAIDIDGGKRDLATAFGATFLPPGALSTDSQDRVVHASAHPDGLAEALRIAGPEAVVAEASWYGDKPVPAPLGAGFHPKRLTLKSSQVGNLPTGQRPRWDYARRLDTALGLLTDDRLDALLTGEDAFADLPTAMQRLASGPGGILTHVIAYP